MHVLIVLHAPTSYLARRAKDISFLLIDVSPSRTMALAIERECGNNQLADIRPAIKRLTGD